MKRWKFLSRRFPQIYIHMLEHAANQSWFCERFVWKQNRLPAIQPRMIEWKVSRTEMWLVSQKINQFVSYCKTNRQQCLDGSKAEERHRRQNLLKEIYENRRLMKRIKNLFGQHFTRREYKWQIFEIIFESVMGLAPSWHHNILFALFTSRRPWRRHSRLRGHDTIIVEVNFE